ncbi:MAG: hypothetical protein LUQ65_09830, partial [Candidatus Helarchaeota archaeon]|nr:hypothetical protein [Candidatus Helarchaeota archaeon]
MDAKERMLKAINHEEADRVPSLELSIDNLRVYKHYGSKYSMQSMGPLSKAMHYLFLGSSKLTSKVLVGSMSKKIALRAALKNIDKLYAQIGIDLSIISLALYPISFDKTGYIDEYARRMEFKKNPEDGMSIDYYRGGVLKEFEDFKTFYEEHPLDPDALIRKNAYTVAKEFEAKRKGRLYYIPTVMGMMESSWEGFGLEIFSRLLTKRKEIKEIFDQRGQFAVELTKRIIEWGETGAILIFDDYGYKKGLFMSPKNYRDFVFPWLTNICDVAHKGGLKVILHSCGDIYTILEDLIKCGVDAIHPIEPTTANPDYDIFKLKEKYG